MPGTPTANYSIPTIDGSADTIDTGDDQINAALTAIDAAMVGFASGTFAGRPTSSVGTPGIAGRRYYATDLGIEYFDTGTGWRPAGAHSGQVVSTGRSTAPDGYLMCDGTQVNRGTYASLFAA